MIIDCRGFEANLSRQNVCNWCYDSGYVLYWLHIMDGWCMINGGNNFGNGIRDFYAGRFTAYDGIETIVIISWIVDDALVTIWKKGLIKSKDQMVNSNPTGINKLVTSTNSITLSRFWLTLYIARMRILYRISKVVMCWSITINVDGNRWYSRNDDKTY